MLAHTSAEVRRARTGKASGENRSSPSSGAPLWGRSLRTHRLFLSRKKGNNKEHGSREKKGRVQLIYIYIYIYIQDLGQGLQVYLLVSHGSPPKGLRVPPIQFAKVGDNRWCPFGSLQNLPKGASSTQNTRRQINPSGSIYLYRCPRQPPFQNQQEQSKGLPVI